MEEGGWGQIHMHQFSFSSNWKNHEAFCKILFMYFCNNNTKFEPNQIRSYWDITALTVTFLMLVVTLNVHQKETKHDRKRYRQKRKKNLPQCFHSACCGSLCVNGHRSQYRQWHQRRVSPFHFPICTCLPAPQNRSENKIQWSLLINCAFKKACCITDAAILWSSLIVALSPVNYEELCQRWKQTPVHLLVIWSDTLGCKTDLNITIP